MLIFHVTNNHAFNFDSMNIVFVFQSGHTFVLNSRFVESRKQIQIWRLAQFILQRGNLNSLQMYGLSLGPAKFQEIVSPIPLAHIRTNDLFCYPCDELPSVANDAR